MKKDNFRVLLIYPNTMMATLIPMHVSILSACLKRAGVEVELFDTTYYRTEEINFEQRKVDLLQIKRFNLEKSGVYFKNTDIYQDLKDKVEEFKPNLVGITIVEDTFDLAKSLLAAIAPYNIPTIAGGVFVTFTPRESLSLEGVDMICVGEGEDAIVELVQKMAKGEQYSDIRNLWVRKNGKIIKNILRPPKDLNELPYIDFDIFEPSRLSRPMYGRVFKMLHVELDRGCPFNCTYCEAPALRKTYEQFNHKNYYRQKNSQRAFEEIKFLVDKYKPDYINFNAESFLARNEKSFKEFAALYKSIGIPFWCQSRPETVTEEKISILKEMNCAALQFGIEVGNEEFRAKILRRVYPNQKIVEGLKIVEKYKIPYTVNNIIGFPGESRDLIFETIRLNRQINPRTMNCYLFTPYKGSYLYNYCIEKKYLDRNARTKQVLDGAGEDLRLDTISYRELKGLQRTFSLYARFPEDEFDKIKIAEHFDEEGNHMFEELREIYYKRFF